MSFSDPGIQVDASDNVSDQSGDTLLLEDEDDENVNTYADALRRERNNRTYIAPGSQAESYLGRGRLVTEFEHSNFGLDNITPGRPCTAYFSAGYFVDSKAVFDKLSELDIPHEAVVCLQRRPSRDMLITFKDEGTFAFIMADTFLRTPFFIVFIHLFWTQQWQVIENRSSNIVYRGYNEVSKTNSSLRQQFQAHFFTPRATTSWPIVKRKFGSRRIDYYPKQLIQLQSSQVTSPKSWRRRTKPGR